MDVRRALRIATATALTGTALGTAWGLSVSVLMSEPAVRRAALPDSDSSVGHGRSERVVTARYGTGDGEVGISFDGETRGPASFGVDDRGRIWVLDAVNRRVLRFEDGSCDRSITLPSDGFEDLVVARDRVCVLERNDERRVLVLDDSEGSTTVPIDDAVPPVFRLFVVGADIVVECPGVDGREYYTVGRLDGTPVSPDEKNVPRAGGTPIPCGGTLDIKKHSDNDIAVDVVDARGRSSARLRVHSDRDVAAILDATSDRAGNIRIAWALTEDRDPAQPATSRIAVTSHSPEGELIGRMEAGRDEYAEPFRRFAFSESGELYQMENTRAGMRILRWTLAP